MSFLKEMFAFVSDQIILFHNLSIKMLKFLFRQIKMSSPNLNNLIIVGCLLSYSGVIILGLDSSLTSEPAFRYICTVKAWVLMAGFTLSFGSMFSKTWRVHSIFTNVQLNKKVRKKINGIVLLFFLSSALVSWSLLKNVSAGQNFRVSVLCGNFPVFRFVSRKKMFLQ